MLVSTMVWDSTPPVSGDNGIHRGSFAGRETSTADALSSAQRAVLSCLEARGGTSSAVVLARDVTARRNGVSPDAVDASEVRRTYTDLCRETLPALSSRGFVEYARTEGRVRLTAADQ